MKNEKKPGNTFVRVFLPHSPEAEGEKQENLENKEKENVQ